MTKDFNPKEKNNAKADAEPAPEKADLDGAPEADTLKAENQKLKADLAALTERLEKFVGPAPKAGHQQVFIKSNNVPAVRRNGKKYCEGYVNGVKFEVECDVRAEVPNHVAEALKGVIEAQKG